MRCRGLGTRLGTRLGTGLGTMCGVGGWGQGWGRGGGDVLGPGEGERAAASRRAGWTNMGSSDSQKSVRKERTTPVTRERNGEQAHTRGAFGGFRASKGMAPPAACGMAGAGASLVQGGSFPTALSSIKRGIITLL